MFCSSIKILEEWVILAISYQCCVLNKTKIIALWLGIKDTKGFLFEHKRFTIYFERGFSSSHCNRENSRNFMFVFMISSLYVQNNKNVGGLICHWIKKEAIFILSDFLESGLPWNYKKPADFGCFSAYLTFRTT